YNLNQTNLYSVCKTMNDKYPEQSEVEWTLLSLLNNKQTNQCQQPEKIIEASSTSMEPISILEHMKIWEESFLFSQPPNINTNSNTADTTISSKEKTTEESNAYYTKDKWTTGRQDISKSGSGEASQQTWSITPPDQTYLDMSSYLSSLSSMPTISDTGYVQNTVYIPSIITEGEESLLDTV